MSIIGSRNYTYYQDSDRSLITNLYLGGKMGMKKDVSKMFNVLVVGGSLMASTSLYADTSSDCKLELVKNSDLSKETTCLDEFDQNLSLVQILEEIEARQSEQCMSPFCNCWLG